MGAAPQPGGCWPEGTRRLPPVRQIRRRRTRFRRCRCRAVPGSRPPRLDDRFAVLGQGHVHPPCSALRAVGGNVFCGAAGADEPDPTVRLQTHLLGAAVRAGCWETDILAVPRRADREQDEGVLARVAARLELARLEPDRLARLDGDLPRQCFEEGPSLTDEKDLFLVPVGVETGGKGLPRRTWYWLIAACSIARATASRRHSTSPGAVSALSVASDCRAESPGWLDPPGLSRLAVNAWEGSGRRPLSYGRA